MAFIKYKSIKLIHAKRKIQYTLYFIDLDHKYIIKNDFILLKCAF